MAGCPDVVVAARVTERDHPVQRGRPLLVPTFGGMHERRTEREGCGGLLDGVTGVAGPVGRGAQVVQKFSSENIRTNCTLVFSAGQAILAAKAGAGYVSPFIGRLDDVGTDGLELIAQIVNIYNNYGYATEVLAASVRHTMHLIQCAELGADVATCPLSVILGLLKHPLTDSGLEKFLADYKKVNG